VKFLISIIISTLFLSIFQCPSSFASCLNQVLSSLANSNAQPTTEAWLKEQVNAAGIRLEGKFKKAGLKPEGVCLAADSDPLNEYNRFWVRDNAIAIHEVNNRSLDQAYIDYNKVLRVEAQKSPNGLGQAIFDINGKWVKWVKQNDGPGYRILRDQDNIDLLLKENKFADAKKLYLEQTKLDADYLCQEKMNNSYELWEEEEGLHTHTLAMDHAGLTKAHDLAVKFEGGTNSQAAIKYQAAADEIRQYIEANGWDPIKQYIKSTIKRTGGFENGGLTSKEPLDTAVILAALHTSQSLSADQMILKFTDDHLLSTMQKLEESFEKDYRINQNLQQASRRGAVFLGRYSYDVYHGGNPWVLTTNAGGEFYYQFADALVHSPVMKISATNQGFYARLLNTSLNDSRLVLGKEISGDFKNSIVLASKEKGDAYVELIRSVMPQDGILSEQIGRGYDPSDRIWPWAKEYLSQVGVDGSSAVPGKEIIGAKNLTWNDASLVTLAKARAKLIKTMSELNIIQKLKR